MTITAAMAVLAASVIDAAAQAVGPPVQRAGWHMNAAAVVQKAT